MLAYIGLGSNLEDPLAQVHQAFSELADLPDSTLVSRSPLYTSAPIGPGEQPDYVNAVALVETQLTPIVLLDELQAIEQKHRRVRLERWGPRTLDLDILLLDNLSIDSERLKVPHPYLTQRNFVLYPLADISPQLTLPDGRSVQELIALCPPNGLTQLE